MSQEDIHAKIKELSNRVTAAQTRVQDKTAELNRLKNDYKELSKECLDTCGFDISKLQEKRDQINSDLVSKVNEAERIYNKIIQEENNANS
jgi:peptidoglycan hydrolase CwlO-like protein